MNIIIYYCIVLANEVILKIKIIFEEQMLVKEESLIGVPRTFKAGLLNK
jgi:hypothetical protein